MLRPLLLLSVLWPATLVDATRPLTPLPVSTFFPANAAALVQTGAYHRGMPHVPACERPGILDATQACAGRDGLVVWRRGVRLQLVYRGLRT